MRGEQGAENLLCVALESPGRRGSERFADEFLERADQVTDATLGREVGSVAWVAKDVQPVRDCPLDARAPVTLPADERVDLVCPRVEPGSDHLAYGSNAQVGRALGNICRQQRLQDREI